LATDRFELGDAARAQLTARLGMDDCEAPFASRDEVAKVRGIIVEQDEVESPENSLQVIPATGAWIGTVGLGFARPVLISA
jgi:hypothetical protein